MAKMSTIVCLLCRQRRLCRLNVSRIAVGVLCFVVWLTFKSNFHKYYQKIHKEGCTCGKYVNQANLYDVKYLLSAFNGATYLNISQLDSYLVEPRVRHDTGHEILIFIQSSPLNRNKRELIRETWANMTYYNINDRPIVIFTCGIETRCGCVTQAVMNEAIKRNDVLLLSINDTYDNLSLKGLLTMSWIEYSIDQRIKYVIKTDDDVILNTFLWISCLRHPMFLNVSRFILGYVWQKPIVKRTGRYAVSVKEYPEDYYPAFCTGSGYAMSRAAMSMLLKVISRVPFLKRDDPFITGVLASECKVSRYTFKKESYILYPIDFQNNVTWHRTVLVHGANETLWHDLWNTYMRHSPLQLNHTTRITIKFVTSENMPKKVVSKTRIKGRHKKDKL